MIRVYPPAPSVSDRETAPSPVRKWLFAVVPIVALVEFFAQVGIAARVPRERDWRAAHDFIARNKHDGDLVASAPLWTDPLARQYLSDLIAMRDAARPDATRYRRALVVTAYGQNNPDLRGWRQESERSFGRLTVRTMVNPQPATVLYDFTEHLRPPEASASRVLDEPHPCEFHDHLFVAGGGLGQGALPGPERFQCAPEPWLYIGLTTLEDMEHRGRRCIWSHPTAGGAMVTRFTNVPLGTRIHGHHAIAYEAERGDDFGNVGGPVELRVLVDDHEVGTDDHRDGEGWKLFEFDTRAYAGSPHTVSFEVRAENPGNRHYCFEADAR